MTTTATRTSGTSASGTPDTGSATGARPVVQVEGVELTGRLLTALRSVVVDTDVAGPDACRLVLDDPARDVLADTALDLAARLTVTAGPPGGPAAVTLFDGLVHAIGYDFDERGGWTTVTAYDRSYALYTGTHTASYQDVTDADLATAVAREVGLDVGEVDATDVVHPHVAQVNETHVALLERRAREAGRVLLVTGTSLSFVRPPRAGDAPRPGDHESRGRRQLVPGANLERLSVRVTGAQQVAEVEVRGWDPASKRELVATTSAATSSADLRDTPASVADRFGRPRAVGVDVPVAQQAECDALARAWADHLGGACVHAEGVAAGDPLLVAGTPVSLGETGGRFDGKVTLTRARHVWEGDGYRTHFTASGSHDRSVLGLVRGGAPTAAPRAPGLVIGVVTNVADPDGLGRVRLRYPWLDGHFESDWARVVHVGAGNDRGLQILPEVDDEVLVGFEHGDRRSAFVLGGLYNGVDVPPRDSPVASSGTVDLRVWRSRTGHEVVLDDTDGAGKVVVRTAGDTVVVTLDVAAKSVSVTCDGDVKVDAQGTVQVDAKGDLKVAAQGSASITGAAGLTLESSGKVTVKGATIALN
ncbi:VgrG-related protein [Cellulomonas phragmiteti]|uniref:Type IV secretion protein Rhs n=1 Tax=Cellulomonas phragmiteti TaxID=478780 RepID=A0ABQ4DP90_9CELL|nr:VgrG-related protein [Cellulomonas phragmiteti]GIG41154.1 type IV secretion protein Rhs [Cellulomonas phragmiteti]